MVCMGTWASSSSLFLRIYHCIHLHCTHLHICMQAATKPHAGGDDDDEEASGTASDRDGDGNADDHGSDADGSFFESEDEDVEEAVEGGAKPTAEELLSKIKYASPLHCIALHCMSMSIR